MWTVLKFLLPGVGVTLSVWIIALGLGFVLGVIHGSVKGVRRPFSVKSGGGLQYPCPRSGRWW